MLSPIRVVLSLDLLVGLQRMFKYIISYCLYISIHDCMWSNCKCYLIVAHHITSWTCSAAVCLTALLSDLASLLYALMLVPVMCTYKRSFGLHHLAFPFFILKQSKVSPCHLTEFVIKCADSCHMYCLMHWNKKMCFLTSFDILMVTTEVYKCCLSHSTILKCFLHLLTSV